MDNHFKDDVVGVPYRDEYLRGTAVMAMEVPDLRQAECLRVRREC
jgi:hypothetical protein